jgi:hypothetical protein
MDKLGQIQGGHIDYYVNIITCEVYVTHILSVGVHQLWTLLRQVNSHQQEMLFDMNIHHSTLH